MKPLKILMIIVAAGVLIFAAISFFAAKKILPLRNINPQSTEWVKLADISPVMQKAVIIAEDPRFYSHKGVDIKLVYYSLKQNLSDRQNTRGASTITMQVAKNLFTGRERERTWSNKIKEAFYAIVMDALLTKERILEIYLNIAEWGENINGVEAASKFYFKKPASELNIEEAAYLASILPNPKLANDPAYKMRFELVRMLLLERLLAP